MIATVERQPFVLAYQSSQLYGFYRPSEKCAAATDFQVENVTIKGFLLMSGKAIRSMQGLEEKRAYVFSIANTSSQFMKNLKRLFFCMVCFLLWRQTRQAQPMMMLMFMR